MKTLKLKDDSYIVIQSWMTTELELKGNSLIVYAIIFGFSQTDQQICTCGDAYMASWIGSTTRAVINIKNALLKRGLIIKSDGFDGDKRLSGYIAVRPQKREKISPNPPIISKNISYNYAQTSEISSCNSSKVGEITSHKNSNKKMEIGEVFSRAYKDNNTNFDDKNNIQHNARVRAHKVTVEQFVKTVGCEHWQYLPNRDLYFEIRDILISLINDNEISLDDILLSDLDSFMNAMYEHSDNVLSIESRKRKHITNLRQYLLIAVKKNRRARMEGN